MGEEAIEAMEDNIIMCRSPGLVLMYRRDSLRRQGWQWSGLNTSCAIVRAYFSHLR